MPKCDVTAKSFPRGKLSCEARLKRAAVGSYFIHILRRIRTAHHFAPHFPISFCIPPPSSAPASRGTFPQGNVLAVRDSYESQRRNKKSLAEFADGSRQIKSNHFPSGRVPDGKYISGCKSSAAALCRAQPPQAALSASQCELFAVGEQGVRAADCKSLSEKPVRAFSTVRKAPPCVQHSGVFQRVKKVCDFFPRFKNATFFVKINFHEKSRYARQKV